MPIVCRQCGANNSGNFLCLACGAPLTQIREASASVPPESPSPAPVLDEVQPEDNVAIATELSPEPIHDLPAEASTAASNVLAEDIRTFFESKPPVEPIPPPRPGRYAVLAVLGLAAAFAGWHWRDLQAFAAKLAKPAPAQSAATQPAASAAPQPVPEAQPATPQPESATPTQSPLTPPASGAAPQLHSRRAQARIQPASRVTRVADTEETQGEKYLHGDGVPVDCDRAQKDLMAAAKHSSAKAETALGSMYATGHCAIRDLPLAYRWFARAQKQNRRPDPKIAADMQRLWDQMSPEQRQLATR